MNVKESAGIFRSPKKLYTYQDYLDLPEDGERYEVINGELVMAPAPSTGHQSVSVNLVLALGNFFERHKYGKMFHAPIDVVLSETTVLQPDIVFIENDRLGIITEKNIVGPPDLVIEIISPSSAYHDLIEKKEIYQKFGVKEYWIVDPKKHWLEIHSNETDKFRLMQRVEKTGIANSIVLPGFKIQLETIFNME